MLLPSFKLWPVHPQPQPDEILSSWMIRLAHTNHYKTHDFYASYFGQDKQIWNRDIDHHAPEWLLQGLSQRTGQSLEKIQQTTLQSYAGFVFERLNPTGETKGILPLGIYHRMRKKFGQQFCPLCLKEDRSPYFRKSWRLAYKVACIKHQILLCDCCPHCQTAIMPYRLDMQNKTFLVSTLSLLDCAQCGYNISNAYRIKTSQDTLHLQQTILSTISLGFAEINHTPIYSFIFLEGIRAIIQGYARTIKKTPTRVTFEHLRTNTRYQLLTECAKLLQNWPNEYLKFCRTIKQPYTNFVLKNTNSIAPYWISSALKKL